MIVSSGRVCAIAVLALLYSVPSASPAVPGFTITATDVKISGQDTASTTFTVTSTSGFAGKVGVYCQGPNPNLLGDVVLAQCTHPTQNVNVPAGGSATGTIEFYPPWTTPPDEPAATSAGIPRTPASSLPLMAGMFVGLGLMGLRFRKRALPVAAACLALFAGTAGCTGHPGLAMTPGSYIYTIHGATPPNAVPSASAATNITVRVNCNSCP